jgi:hypothetical protein
MFHGCTKLFLCKSVSEKMYWYETGKNEVPHIYIHGTMMNSKLQPFLLFEANCAPIMWKRKTNKKLCSKARENEILQTGWIGIEHRPVYASLAVKKSTFFVNML